jgi:hypothetical protein
MMQARKAGIRPAPGLSEKLTRRSPAQLEILDKEVELLLEQRQ